MRDSPALKALRAIRRDKWAMACLMIIAAYCLAALLAQLGLLAKGYGEVAGAAYHPPCRDHLLGTDFLGRDVLKRVLVGTRIAMSVGLITSLIAIPIGVFFGSLAGYYRGKADDFIIWLYSTLDSIPYLILLLALTLVLGKGLTSVYIAIGLTSWVGVCRIVRGEFIRQGDMDYVQAARALGMGNLRIICLHILPNVLHLIIINFSLMFVSAVKAEVILSYLGVGAQGEPSWGIMISDARMELIGRGVYWQLLGATAAMFFIILAFNLFADALRDALDPRVAKGKK